MKCMGWERKITYFSNYEVTVFSMIINAPPF